MRVPEKSIVVDKQETDKQTDRLHERGHHVVPDFSIGEKKSRQKLLVILRYPIFKINKISIRRRFGWLDRQFYLNCYLNKCLPTKFQKIAIGQRGKSVPSISLQQMTFTSATIAKFLPLKPWSDCSRSNQHQTFRWKLSPVYPLIVKASPK